MDRVYIVYSSRTGNTEKVARGVFSILKREYPMDIYTVDDVPIPGDADRILLGFWVDRGTADAKSLAYLSQIQGKRIGLFGTLGAYPDSDHARDVITAVGDVITKKNTLLGSFLCQGRIDPKLTERFETLPPGHPHAMDEARRKRHQDAASHPDEQDIRAATEACRVMLSAVAVDTSG
jgi:flavodoxin